MHDALEDSDRARWIDSVGALIERANQAMYAVKAGGCNRIVIGTPAP